MAQSRPIFRAPNGFTLGNLGNARPLAFAPSGVMGRDTALPQAQQRGHYQLHGKSPKRGRRQGDCNDEGQKTAEATDEDDCAEEAEAIRLGLDRRNRAPEKNAYSEQEPRQVAIMALRRDVGDTALD